VPKQDESVCHECHEATLNYVALRSCAVFQGKLRDAIHQLKYRRNVSLGQVLAQPMIEQLCELDWPIDLVTPVPLGLARMAERGYNQASLLARPIALYFRKLYRPGIIHRCKETRSQVGLPVALRKENVADAFYAERAMTSGKNVLVIDDVITSGATMNACAKALMDAGAKQVYGYSLARGGIKAPHEPGDET
jgi:ComF family protein